jgi:3-hydroxymyristoyl/3-hydroxydecanoyl-(acyl carrier protein) dehydratase
MNEAWSSERVRAVLPHRDEMLLCPAATLGAGRSGARAVLRVPSGTWMERLGCPHLYLLEALGQLAGLLLASRRPPEATEPARGYLVEIPECRFTGSPRPEADVRLSVEPEISFGSLHRFRVRAVARDEVLVEGLLTIATA